MRIVMVNTSANRGGAARVASLLAYGMTASPSVELTLYHAQDRVEHGPLKGLRRPGLRPLNALLARLGGSLWVHDGGLARAIATKMSDADLLHVHNLHGYYLHWIRLFESLPRNPIIWTWHDQWGATGRCGFAIDCNRWMSGCRVCPHKEYYPAAWVDRAKTEHVAKSSILVQHRHLFIVAPSQWLADIAIHRGYAPEKVYVIPNPVDVDKYRPVAVTELQEGLGLGADDVVALFVAADCGDPRKQYSHFARATERAPVRAIAVGKPPRDPAPHVLHVGNVTDPTMLSAYYSLADFLVFTSLADNYPNTVVEAISSGAPVVGYGVGGVPSQLDSQFSICVQPQDSDSLSMAIRNVASRGKKTPQMAEHLHRHARERWHIDEIVGQYHRIYRLAATS